MYDELVKALRGCVLSKPCDGCPYYDPNGPTKECATMNIAAADAIESLEKENRFLKMMQQQMVDKIPMEDIGRMAYATLKRVKA